MAKHTSSSMVRVRATQIRNPRARRTRLGRLPVPSTGKTKLGRPASGRSR